jgi:hypothetical protein
MRRSAPVLAAVLAFSTAACGTTAEYYEEPQTPRAPVGRVASDQMAADAEEARANSQQYADEFDDTDPAAITDFKETLDPYGTWVEDPAYGTVWVPAQTSVGGDFAPYVSAGHWEVDASESYVWVSDYDPTFGWVVFHYGRWVWIDGRGWSWIPGRRYAPAWVVWRVGDPGYDYVGWAPAPPYYYWRSGAVVWLDVYPPAPYVFCHTSYVFNPHVHQHVVGRDHVAAVASRTYPYGSPGQSTRHVLATPQRGPSVRSGHVPAGTWPATRSLTGGGAPHRRYASPSTMGRGPAPSANGRALSAPRSLGTSYAPSAPSRGASSYTPGGWHSGSAPAGHGSSGFVPSAPHTVPGGGGAHHAVPAPHTTAPRGGGGFGHSPSRSFGHSAPSHAPSRPMSVGGGHSPSRGFRPSGGGHRR